MTHVKSRASAQVIRQGAIVFIVNIQHIFGISCFVEDYPVFVKFILTIPYVAHKENIPGCLEYASHTAPNSA